MAKQRIGILGGTFDPIHSGHLQMALSALDAGQVDRLLMIPTGNPPYKACAASGEDRWKMVVSACSRDERLIPSRMEIDRDGPVYTYDTLKALGRIVTRYFGITITPEIFEAEVKRILAIKGVPEYIESMKPSLPYADELAALDNLLNGNTAKADDKNAADKQSE